MSETTAVQGMRAAPTFAGRLVQSRRWLGLNQEDIAARIGVTRRTVSSWENGDTDPSVPQLLEWARVTGFSAAWFVDGLESVVTAGSVGLTQRSLLDDKRGPPPLVGAIAVHWN